jgi:hypothetical protein
MKLAATFLLIGLCILGGASSAEGQQLANNATSSTVISNMTNSSNITSRGIVGSILINQNNMCNFAGEARGVNSEGPRRGPGEVIND